MTRTQLAGLLIVLVPVVALPAESDDYQREGDGEKRALKDELESKTAPPLQVDGWVNTDGKQLSLDQLKGKVVLLDFWGVWCGPCRAAMPHLKELYEMHHAEGLEIVGIHTTSSGAKMAEYVEEESLPWPTAVDVDKATVKAYRVDSYPDYYVIDRKGDLRVADLANKEVDRVIEALLKE